MRMAAPERSRRTPAQSVACKIQLRPSGSIVPASNDMAGGPRRRLASMLPPTR